MDFVIDGRTYKDYELDCTQIRNLLVLDGLSHEQMVCLRQLVRNKFNYNLCKHDSSETEDDVFVRFFSNFVNRKMNDKKEVARKMAKEHRYLQNEMFKVFMEYVKVLASNYNKGYFDERNLYAAQTASKIINALNDMDWPI